MGVLSIAGEALSSRWQRSRLGSSPSRAPSPNAARGPEGPQEVPGAVGGAGASPWAGTSAGVEGGPGPGSETPSPDQGP
eukprot:7344546-Pyramimonas_sp.AAC.1